MDNKCPCCVTLPDEQLEALEWLGNVLIKMIDTPGHRNAERAANAHEAIGTILGARKELTTALRQTTALAKNLLELNEAASLGSHAAKNEIADIRDSIEKGTYQWD